MAMGMSADEFWNGDSRLPEVYRRKYELEQQRMNEQAWLQGAYMYEALIRVAPVIKFSTRPEKPIPYLERPYNLKGEDKKEEKQENNAGLAYMQQFAAMHNKQFKEAKRG